jgi:uncharacterized protein (TIGR02118 family)
MVRVSVIYNVTEGSTFDYDYYVNTHMPMAGREFKAARWEVDKIVGTPDGSPSPIHCVGYLYFDSMDDLQKAMVEPAAGKVMGDIPNYYSGAPTVLISEVVS